MLKSLFINILAPLDIQFNKMKRIDRKASKTFRHLCRSQLLIFKKDLSITSSWMPSRDTIFGLRDGNSKELGDLAVFFTVEKKKKIFR